MIQRATVHTAYGFFNIKIFTIVSNVNHKGDFVSPFNRRRKATNL